MLLRFFDDDGRPVKSHFSVSKRDAHIWDVIIESRGGTLGTQNERNAEYSKGFALLLGRAAQLGLLLRSAYVESKKLLDAGLPRGERILRSPKVQFPIALARVGDLSALISSLRVSQEPVGSETSRGHGNSTRRVLFEFSAMPGSELPADLDYLLANGTLVPDGMAPLGPITPRDVDDAALSEVPQKDFDPEALYQRERRKVLVALAQRQGQPEFRRELMRAYGRRCAITECELEDALEAAHIVAYMGPETNHVQNGLLLRSDLHTLFDRGLIGVDPRDWRVRVHQRLLSTQYRFLDGAAVRIPDDSRRRPNAIALLRHLHGAGLGAPDDVAGDTVLGV